eukprot:610866-Rhodomonas_salina.1
MTKTQKPAGSSISAARGPVLNGIRNGRGMSGWECRSLTTAAHAQTHMSSHDAASHMSEAGETAGARERA